MDIRAQLEKRLTEYVEDTLDYIETARAFCEQEDEWSSERNKELKMLRDINENQEEKKEKLDSVLEDTIKGLKELEPFLEALEKLTVTSSHVFSEQIFLLRGQNPETVRSVISDIRPLPYLLIRFKRNAETYFQPLPENLPILINQLTNYVLNTKLLCRAVKQKSSMCRYDTVGSTSTADIYKDEPLVKLIVNENENTMRQMLDHLEHLCQIRMNQDTRLTFLFQDDAQTFIEVFSERRSRMWQFLSDLEETAKKLDEMKYGASVSTVVGSSAGIVGGIMSILGIALAPFTAGASLALTVGGIGLGATSGVNALVTGITEHEVNKHQEHNAQNYLQSYKEDMIKIEECLKEVANSERPLVKPGAVDAFTVGHGAAEVVDKIADGSVAYAGYKTKNVTERGLNLTMRDLEAASDVPEVARYLSRTEQLANAKALGIVKASRVASGVANVFFIGLDIFTIVHESESLAHGSKSKVSHLIRSRAALFKSELEAWEKMQDSLCIGVKTFSKSQETLEKPFLP